MLRYRCGLRGLFALGFALAAGAAGRADDNPAQPTADEIKAAIVKSIQVVEKSTPTYRENRTCFSCHHQAMPVLMLTEAKNRGFAIDENEYRAQIKRAAQHLASSRSTYLKGQGSGGGFDTAGWGLWTLAEAGWKADDSTAAVVNYLIVAPGENSFWRAPGSGRPPTQGSNFTTTYIAIRGMSAFATPQQQGDAAARKDAALKWVLAARAKDNEDRVYRLRTLAYLNADETAVRSAAQELAGRQRPDGGWSQLADAESDAYATGTALVALHEAGGMSATDPAYLKGITYLIRGQLADGTWHVTTRAKPVQVYFESGFPHAKDQFISIAANSWATTALLYTLPVPSATAAAAASGGR